MIYYEHRSVFIHIPRTSGLSVSKAVLAQKNPELSGVNVILGHGLGPFWRHVQAHVLQTALPEWELSELKKFTIVRNPWRICESTYRYFRRKHQQILGGAAEWFDSEIQDTSKRCAESSFEEFILSHFQYLRKGFFAHWGLEWDTFRDLGVVAFQFEELDGNWPRVCELLQLPRATPRPWENGTVPRKTLWTDRAVGFIRQRCALDFELFGYPRHP